MRTILIDDEMNCLEMLEWSLKQSCPNVEILDKCQSGTAGINAIRQHKPDLIFLDIEMRDMTGFEMLKQLNNRPSVEVIFTTAYDQFAVEAFKVSAVDYLLKPIDEAELKLAVEKVHQRLGKNGGTKQMEFILDLIKEKMNPESGTVAIPSGDGLEFLQVREIIHCQADRNYTSIHFATRKPLLVSKTLKEIEGLLPEQMFFRVHHSSIVNMQHIRRFTRTDGGFLVMSNGDQVKVSRSKKDLLLEKL